MASVWRVPIFTSASNSRGRAPSPSLQGGGLSRAGASEKAAGFFAGKGSKERTSNDDGMPSAAAAGALAAIARLNYHERFQPVRIGRWPFLFAGRFVPFMAVGTLVMKN